jgi:hypothetical protein
VFIFGASAICGSEKVDMSFAHVIGSVVNEGSSSEIREGTVPDDQFYTHPRTTSLLFQHDEMD